MFARLFTLTAAIGGASFVAMAQTPPPPPAAPPPMENIAQHKQRELDGISTRIQLLQTQLACVQGAQEQTALRACNEAARASMPRRPR